MARIRTIKPDFFQSEDVASLSYRARLTWIGLWTYVDDEGRCKDNARLIKGHAWPLEDDVTAVEVERDLDELAAKGRVTRYQVDGDQFIQVNKWLDHQRIAKPSRSKLPEPPATPTDMVADHSTTIPVVLPESSTTPTEPLPGGREGKGKGKGVEGKRSPHPLPPDFAISEDMRHWASNVTPAVDVERKTFEFVHYWTKGGGAGKRKTDWPQTWRNNMKQKQEWAERDGWKPAPAPGKDLNNPKNW